MARLPYLLLALVASASVAFQLFRDGIGITVDSVYYIAAANSLLDGNGFIGHNGEPLVWWPPLFPTILAAGHLVSGVGPRDFGALLHVFLMGFMVYFFGWISLRHIGSTWLRLVSCGVLATSFAIHEVFTRLWSEPIFLVLLLLQLFLIQRWQETLSLRGLVAIIACAALAALQRYIGVTCVLLACASVLWHRKLALSNRLSIAAAVAFAGTLPLALWLLRNWWLTGNMTGEYPLSTLSVLEQAWRAYAYLASWVVYPRGSLSLLMPVLFVGSLAYATIRSHAVAAASLPAMPCRAVILPAAFFCLFYAAFLLITTSRMQVDPMSDRLLIPLLPAMVILAATAVDRVLVALRSCNTRTARLTGLALLALSTLWLGYPLSILLARIAH